MNNFRRIHILFEPDLLEALTQECRRLKIPRATLVKLLCREFIGESEEALERLKTKGILRSENDR